LLKRQALGPLRFLRYTLTDSEGQHEALFVDQELGRLAGLIRLRSDYSKAIAEVRSARWRHSDRLQDPLAGAERNPAPVESEAVAVSQREIS
jgi:hypothetical protein